MLVSIKALSIFHKIIIVSGAFKLRRHSQILALFDSENSYVLLNDISLNQRR